MTALPRYWQILSQLSFCDPSLLLLLRRFPTESGYRGNFPVPPPYSVATSLPTYDEAEKAKAASLATSTVDVMPRVRTAFLFRLIGPFFFINVLPLSRWCSFV